MPTTGERFERAVNIMARLRAPGGCPWDREQTFDSIKPYTVEETYEVLEAIDQRDWQELPGELGDLLLQVLFYAEMAREAGHFSIDDVLERLSGKLVHRHPHVFGDVEARTSAEVLHNWEKLKEEEKRKQREVGGKEQKKDTAAASLLDGVSPAMPALLEARKLSSRAANVGFDWPEIDGLFDKLHEETEELRQKLKDWPEPGPRPNARGVPGSAESQIPEDLRRIAGPDRRRTRGPVFYPGEPGAVSFDRRGIGFAPHQPEVPRPLPADGGAPSGAGPAAAGSVAGGDGEAVAGVQAGRKRAVTDAVVIRSCQSLEELELCMALQKETWGFSDAELVPLRLFVVAQKIGGQVLGAFDGERLLGYALAFPGWRDGRPFLHSHMLAVRAEQQNSGLGRRIKLFQREDALARGYELMEWTFDPLEIKNSYLNLTRLGAIARRYNENQYGLTSSPLQGGLPSDRLVAEWWLRSRRVRTLLDSGKLPAYEVEGRVTVPAEIYEWKQSLSDRGKALDVQTQNREQLQRAFAQGLAAVGYERDEQGNGAFLLAKWGKEA